MDFQFTKYQLNSIKLMKTNNIKAILLLVLIFPIMQQTKLLSTCVESGDPTWSITPNPTGLSRSVCIGSTPGVGQCPEGTTPVNNTYQDEDEVEDNYNEYQAYTSDCPNEQCPTELIYSNTKDTWENAGNPYSKMECEGGDIIS